MTDCSEKLELAAYLRVSTEKQAERGFGLAVQRASVKAFAAAGHHTIPRAAWFADEGESGGEGLDVRVALGEALSAVREGRVQGLILPKLDRFSRDVILQETLLRDIWNAGGQVFSCVPSENALLGGKDDPEVDQSRKMIRTILGAVNEYERTLIVMRMKSGRRIKAAAGGYAGYGSPAFGMHSVNGELAPDAAETAVAAEITRMSGDGMSSRQIAAELNARGLPAKRGGAWSSVTVLRVIQRA